MSKKRLFLLDAYALIFRGYYALIKNPRINSKGEDTSAIMGFMNSLFDVIKREQPDHLAVCFDKGGSSERTELFPAYKANRLETPDAIRLAVPYIQEILRAMHIPVVVLEGLEADDIIGTLAKQAEKEDYQVFMVTPDKDFGQLVSENIFMYRPARMGNGIEIWGIPEIQKRFGVERPEQVIDYLGMMGDASDNIPGLPGVGEKTAKKFLADFGSMENLLANTDQLKGKMKEKVSENAALGLLSKKLATINIHCDVTFNAAAYELSTPDSEKVQAIFEKLEFRRLTEQFLRLFFAPKETPNNPEANSQKKAEATSAGSGQFGLFDTAENSTDGVQIFSSRKTINEVSHHYQLVSPGLGMKLFTQKLLQQPQVCFDTETTSLDPLEANLVGLAFSWEAHKGFYISLPEDQEETSEILSELKAFFQHEGIEKVGQNLKYDLKVLHRYGIEVKGPCFDTMLAHYLINPDMRHNLSVLSETYLNYTPIAIETLIGKGKQKISMREVALDQQVAYAVEDADLCFQLAQQFKTELAAAGNESLFVDMEAPLLRVLAGMELEGINLDVAFLNELSVTLDKDILQLEKDIYEAAGETFNIASPKQLGDILFGKMQLVEKPKKTKTGQYSTAEDVLSYLAKEHKIIADVLAYRGLAKLKSTYVDALPLQVSAQTGRVHTDYMQTVAATGRLSSNNPNLQNIPIRTERGKQIRKAFIPRDQEHLLLAADYSQIELRIIAALSEEDNMIAAFKEGADIHAATAAKVFNVPLESVSREQRSHAKTVNFGIIYGVSAFGLSNQTDLSRAESKALIDTYYESYPKLKAYMNSQVNFARENGYVETVLGRRRYLKDINANNAIVRGAAERNAVNAPIQGSAADIIKLAMIAVQKALDDQKLRTKMLLQVHDELVFDVYKPELEQVKALVKSAMENAFTLTVPLDVELGVGENWLEAH
ncbi:MAG: DNA polymerase I [Polaribacter sp. BACL8 MAG-120531-bin13]|jgi:DNA polymerase-1|nr:MAG: DNA polymerase I [Polaribacter sp. BACL8 MAG-120531-bin13]KRP14576.1 MAG: DNA polymerase I [Polaribacter sp. BACL8 MAG-120419-bin8]MBT4840433.1 DNA polymerase I [Flavobacteriaceae bacterium]MBT5394801.1 DNA polymerase I [Flavobacteriaceae bacterium]MBT5922037.1 DNA polymerase I [Flavobacteriaceae bacterium]|tara:strand:+ start:27290 stop:30115 length:2826 start_codon:yes stop_codon:yes gene_type:complete